MARCGRCGRGGLFFKVNKANGLCAECEASLSREKTRAVIPVENTMRPDIPSSAVDEQAKKPRTQCVGYLRNGITVNVHPDLDGLIWTNNNDPSCVGASLAATFPKEDSFMEPLPYYPNYSEMNVLQRGKYLQFLKDPYQEIEIGYVFVLYYGLERHLISGKYERAFEVILKLRDVHTNKSFQSHSASALIYTALARKREDLLMHFIEEVDKPYEEEIPFNMFMVVCNSFHIDIAPSFLMRYASKFMFTNKRYIVGNYELFRKTLAEVLMELYNKEGLPTDKINIKALPSCGQAVFSNISLNKQAMDFPDVSEAYEFIGMGNAALKVAHDRVKAYLKNTQALSKSN